MEWAKDLATLIYGGDEVKEEVCMNDDSITDRYGATCSYLYDSSPEYCGMLDSAQFQAYALCCACGGGITTVS